MKEKRANLGVLPFLLLCGIVAFVGRGDTLAEDSGLSGQWINSHWFHPLPPMGKKPTGFSDLEASLIPKDCGECHEKQYSDWSASRHSKSMGNGVVGQFHPPWIDDKMRVSCQECHAPLYEQNPVVVAGGEIVKNRLYKKDVASYGVSCAVCHVRKHVRYGPIPRKLQDPDTPHNGFIEKNDFNSSEFCKPCHQFNPNGRSLNGKLMQDTYEQWKRSPAAKEGKVCASCHMPDRKHIFQGVHHEQMVNEGLSVDLERGAEYATLSVKNTGVGHKFPTYVTPKVVVSGKVINLDGKAVDGTLKEYYIQWSVSLDLSEEYFDTRLDPDETLKAYFKFPMEHSGNIFEIDIRVYPDEFYRRFYEAMIANPPKGVDVPMLKKALKEVKSSDFSVYNRRVAF